ncbi:MAG TPA: pitrilysin family protein [Chloroflexota bacterium]|nr:pitrilysin family protein [Chloroflexota bacterium]
MTTTLREPIFHTHELSNGLHVLGQYMPDVQSAAAVFWVDTGTRDENPQEMGVSHFLEHMAFKRTERLTGEEIDRAFEELGADHNAATGREMTFYWARTLRENVPGALGILTQLLQPALDESDFDQERQVILEEIARAEDQAAHVLFSNFLRDYFEGHPLALDTLGTTQTIGDLTVEEMRGYWSRRYGTRNTLFAIAGNFDWDGVIGDLEHLTAGWQRGESGRREQPVEFRPGLHVYPHAQFVQEQIAIGTPMVPRSDPRYYAAILLATILGDDRGSRLFWSVYQTGLAETASAESLEFEDNGLFVVHIATAPEQATAAVRAARSEMKRLQEFDVSEDELERAKTKVITSVILGGESTNERVMGLINSWMTQGKLETLEEIRGKIEAVTLADLRSLLSERPIWPDQLISATGPLTEEELRPAL